MDTKSAKCGKCNIILGKDCHSSLTKAMNFIDNHIAKIALNKKEMAIKAVDNPKPVAKDKNINTVPRDDLDGREPLVCGLRNTGVICFFNSVLQNLVQTPLLRGLLDYTNKDYHEVIYHPKYGSLHVKVPNETAKNMITKYTEFLSSLDVKERSKPLHAYQVSL